jgi:hypothetical protein
VGSSKIVARSFAQSSPGCDPTGVIFTFCAKDGDAATPSPKASAAAVIAALMIFSLGSAASLSGGRAMKFISPRR